MKIWQFCFWWQFCSTWQKLLDSLTTTVLYDIVLYVSWVFDTPKMFMPQRLNDCLRMKMGRNGNSCCWCCCRVRAHSAEDKRRSGSDNALRHIRHSSDPIHHHKPRLDHGYRVPLHLQVHLLRPLLRLLLGIVTYLLVYSLLCLLTEYYRIFSVGYNGWL